MSAITMDGWEVNCIVFAWIDEENKPQEGENQKRGALEMDKRQLEGPGSSPIFVTSLCCGLNQVTPAMLASWVTTGSERVMRDDV